jgi:hypothetical protein
MTSKWFYNNEKKSKRKKKEINWDFEKKTLHWKQFFENATVVEETSKVVCKRCTIVFFHSEIEIENSIMINHLSSIKCKKTFKIKELKRFSLNLKYQATIKELS